MLCLLARSAMRSLPVSTMRNAQRPCTSSAASQFRRLNVLEPSRSALSMIKMGASPTRAFCDRKLPSVCSICSSCCGITSTPYWVNMPLTSSRVDSRAPSKTATGEMRCIRVMENAPMPRIWRAIHGRHFVVFRVSAMLRKAIRWASGFSLQRVSDCCYWSSSYCDDRVPEPG